MRWLKFFLLLIFLGLASQTFSQEVIDQNAKSPMPRSGSKKEKAALKKKEKQQVQLEKAIAKAKKQHYKNQTKDVRKRMKKSQKEANRRNSNKKEFFLKRWFTKKHR